MYSLVSALEILIYVLKRDLEVATVDLQHLCSAVLWDLCQPYLIYRAKNIFTGPHKSGFHSPINSPRQLIMRKKHCLILLKDKTKQKEHQTIWGLSIFTLKDKSNHWQSCRGYSTDWIECLLRQGYADKELRQKQDSHLKSMKPSVWWM